MPNNNAGYYDVAIVGYGPVGATLANLLARYGLKIAVVEQQPDIYDKPRAITIDHEVLRVFQSCGIAHVMEKGIAPHPGTHYLGVDRDVIKIFDPMPPPYPLGWVPTATMVQPDVERALREQFAMYGNADIFMPARAIEFEQDDAGVSLTIDAAGTKRNVRARYLVGCDGANSIIRKALGIALDDLAFDEWWMVVDAFAKDLTRRPNKCLQYCWPARPGTFLPGPGALRRWEIKLLPGETPQDFSSNDSVVAVLKNFTDTSDLTIWRSAVYRFHALLARHWRAGRIFLMGDAVHQTPPFLGQGLSAGIRDAFNLAWKLDLVLAGKAGDALLDTYEAERQPHVGAVVATAKDFGKIIGELEVDAAKARDERLRTELREGTAQTIRQKFIPDLTTGLIAADTPLAGSLFVQPHIRQRDGAPPTRLDDLMPPGFVIAATSAEVLRGMSADARQAWRMLGGANIVILDCSPATTGDAAVVLQEQDRLFAEWMRAKHVEAVVVRPDRYVFGGAATAEQLDALVCRLAESLTGHFS
jgi:3-(3-hydroxy-phenyl)propionate hydroxylase